MSAEDSNEASCKKCDARVYLDVFDDTLQVGGTLHFRAVTTSS